MAVKVSFTFTSHLIQTLTTLNLAWNQIEDAVDYLSNALQTNTVRQILESCITYIQHLDLIQTLTTLNLAWNQIGDQGAQYLANALQTNMVR
jgi:hypothetical protein